MGSLNTFFNHRSAVHNAATAANTAATAEASAHLVSFDRRRQLRERGLITLSSTPAEIAAVEHRLDAQMRVRGACGWCGDHSEHVVEGEKAHPLVFHAVEVEATIANGPN